MIQRVDLGTPPADRSRHGAARAVEVTIDGQTVVVREGTSVMRAAALAGVPIPKLCATDSLEAFGSCRMCLVEIDGVRGTPASCTTPVSDGMQVATSSDRLAKLRRNVMELYISDHPLDCLARGERGLRTPGHGRGRVCAGPVRRRDSHAAAVVDTSNPYFTFDPSKCIVLALRPGLRGTTGNLRAHHLWPRVRVGGRSWFGRLPGFECVSCGACVSRRARPRP
ncbi:MAG: 2Fe-2S iron-sulfur cluster-binding protein [Ilumatobacteraceae bacterium]